MSWDIILFNYTEPIVSVPDIDEGKLLPVNFDDSLLDYYKN
jgi:hypothetical protein